MRITYLPFVRNEHSCLLPVDDGSGPRLPTNRFRNCDFGFGICPFANGTSEIRNPRSQIASIGSQVGQGTRLLSEVSWVRVPPDRPKLAGRSSIGRAAGLYPVLAADYRAVAGSSPAAPISNSSGVAQWKSKRLIIVRPWFDSTLRDHLIVRTYLSYDRFTSDLRFFKSKIANLKSKIEMANAG